MERARGGVPSVGVVKRRVLQGLWRRLVGVGIIVPRLYGAPGSIMLVSLVALFPTSLLPQRGLRFAPSPRCAGPRVVRPRAPSVGRAQLLEQYSTTLSCSPHRLLS